MPDSIAIDIAAPIVKTQGGKPEYEDEITSFMPATMSAYLDPFFGGGAIFFRLYRDGRIKGKNIFLSDFDEDLIELYEAVKADPVDLSHKLELLHTEYQKAPEALYYHIRELWNARNHSPARYVFLHQAAFNGLWRCSKEGGMNAAWGRQPKLSLPSFEKLAAVAKAFEHANFHAGSFEEDMVFHKDDLAKPGTVIYLDPPHLETWNSYTAAAGWTAAYAQRLLRECKEWDDRGAHVVLSHADVPTLHEVLDKLWPNGVRENVTRRNRISRKGDGRGPVPELIVHSKM